MLFARVILSLAHICAISSLAHICAIRLYVPHISSLAQKTLNKQVFDDNVFLPEYSYF